MAGRKRKPPGFESSMRVIINSKKLEILLQWGKVRLFNGKNGVPPMPFLKSGVWFNKNIGRPFQALVKIVIVCAFGAILLQLDKSIAAPPDSSKPPTSNQPMFQPKLPLSIPGTGNVARGEKLYYCGKGPCDSNGKSDKAGCNRSECHTDKFGTDIADPTTFNPALHASSKKYLETLKECPPKMNDNVPCSVQKDIFKGFTEQDFRDLAVFLSSKDKNKYAVSGVINGDTGPLTELFVKSNYLPEFSVKSSAHGSYSITLAAGDYEIVAKSAGYFFSPKSHHITLDFYRTVDYDSDVISDPYSHVLKKVDFTSSKFASVPLNSPHPKINFDKK